MAKSEEAEQRRAAMRAFLARRGMTVNGWATEAGIPESTLRSFLSGKTNSMTMRTYESLARAAGVSVPELLGGKPGAGTHVALRQLDVVGAVQAGAWREALEWDSADWYQVAVPVHPRYAHLRQFGLEVVGDSMNELYPAGTVVACVKLIELGRDPESGEKVVCLRRGAANEFEATIKELRRHDDDSWWLWPRSTNPAFQQPWRLNGSLEDAHDDLLLVALVIGSFRFEG